ncbi:carbohydrate kinase [Polaribacter sejongensis]|uniref:Carbohydrate kinase n=1 Tax=Polaribacter sejongensis TaxID=985043 RepID=A0AAJ1QYP9_9FLAO|nr:MULTISPECIES: FGGY family carbohydrate kinase [Polaribacter]AUC21176.1 carbohydrate kinase [Polaribacter sejongensis]MDN3620545.1 FGGY family carbohydrate kinase [Polaribacter undariae]UWD31251.1 FGGY family carbohydrate kinase [Polaribacter undariae]
MYYLGLDIGSSSIKAALVEVETGKSLGVVQEPKEEMGMFAQKNGWAEQKPNDWWLHICNAIAKLKKEYNISRTQIKGIGISYQMHGLVLVDKKGNPLRKSIIWCDSRAVTIGNNAFNEIGEKKCASHLLNSPANFTASKLKWVQENEPVIYSHIHKFMLPGDYVAFKFSNKINTTISGLSEGIFWDFKENTIADFLLTHYGINKDLVPDIVDTFSIQSLVDEKGEVESGIAAGTPILYRAGDQPNNALSLNVFNPGEVAATGGTSGVVYAVTESLSGKESTRVNNFAHVNYTKSNTIIGKLLNINGAGIQYRWLLNNLAVDSYEEMNILASEIPVGSDGVCLIPFGNGAERMLNNKEIGTRIVNMNLNNHHKGHMCRAALEGIAFSFVYGMEIMKSDGIKPSVIRAGNDNLFRSEIFANTVATLIEQEIEIYNTTGAIGAARAANLHKGDFEAFGKVIMDNDHVMTFMPFKDKKPYLEAYANWKKELELVLNNQ